MDNTKTRLVQLAIWTCEWWNSVFVQTKQYIDSLENYCGRLPWEDRNETTQANRHYLIYAIYNAVKCTRELDLIYKEKNENAFHEVLNQIYDVASWESIVQLRNMNVHELEYLYGKGHKQTAFDSTITLNGKTINTNAKATIVEGRENGGFFIGTINLERLIKTMGCCYPIIAEKTKIAFEESI